MTKMSMVDLYAVLGVDSDADRLTIREAFRRLARRYHPDAGGDPRIMMVLNKAWWILGDADRRAAYDHQRSWPPVAGTRPGAGSDPTSPGPATTPGPAPAPRPFQPPLTPMMTPPPGLRATGSVLDFGRFVGWSIGQLAVYDPDYLLWLERTPIGRPMRREIQETLARTRVEPVPAVRASARRPRSFATLRS